MRRNRPRHRTVDDRHVRAAPCRHAGQRHAHAARRTVCHKPYGIEILRRRARRDQHALSREVPFRQRRHRRLQTTRGRRDIQQAERAHVRRLAVRQKPLHGAAAVRRQRLADVGAILLRKEGRSNHHGAFHALPRSLPIVFAKRLRKLLGDWRRENGVAVVQYLFRDVRKANKRRAAEHRREIVADEQAGGFRQRHAHRHALPEQRRDKRRRVRHHARPVDNQQYAFQRQHFINYKLLFLYSLGNGGTPSLPSTAGRRRYLQQRVAVATTTPRFSSDTGCRRRTSPPERRSRGSLQS